MAAYAIKMWGRTIKDANMEARYVPSISDPPPSQI